MASTRIAVYQFKPGTGDEVIRLAQQGMVPIFRQLPGFWRYTLVRTGAHSGISISIWETKAQADAAVQKAAEWVKGNIADKIVAVQNHVG